MEEHGKSEMLTQCCPAADTDAHPEAPQTEIPLQILGYYNTALGGCIRNSQCHFFFPEGCTEK